MELGELIMRFRDQGGDKLEGRLDRVAEKAEKAEKKTNKLADTLDGFSSVGGPIGAVADHVSELKDRAESSIGTFGRVGGAVTLVGVAAATAVTGLVSLTYAVSKVLADMEDMAARTNIATERLSVLAFTAQLGGSSLEEIVGSSERLAAKFAKQDEETGKAVSALSDLGISAKDASGELKSMLELQEEIVLAVDSATDKAKAEGAAIQLLGSDYYKLRNAIRDTAEKKSEMYDYMQRVGAVATTDLAAKSGKLQDNIDKLGLAFKGMGNSIAQSTVPILDTVIQKLISITSSAADIMRRWGGGSTASELAGDRVSSLRAQIENEERKKGGLVYRQPDQKAKIDARVAQLQAELAIAISDQRTAKLMDERAKNAVTNGKQGEGNRPAGKDAKATGSEKSKDGRLTPEQIAKMQQDDRDRWTNELGQLYAQDAKLTLDAAERIRKQTEEYTKQADAVRDLLNPMRELDREIAAINANPLLSDGEKEAAIVRVSEKWVDSMSKMKDATEDLSEMGQLTFNTLKSSISDMVMGADVNFKTLARSFIKSLLDMYIESQILKPMFDWIKNIGKSVGGGGGFWGAVLGAFTKSASGNVFGPSGLLMSANGNVFDGPTLHGYKGGLGVLGEAGPEAIMPLTRLRNGKLGVMAQGGSGGATVINNVTVNVEGGSNAQDTGNAAMQGTLKAMEQIANKQIANAQRPGGLMNPFSSPAY